MNLWIILLVYFEAVYEAAPQVIMQNYIILSDTEQNIPVIQLVSILTSIIVMSKTSIELYLSFSTTSGSMFVVHFAAHYKNSFFRSRKKSRQANQRQLKSESVRVEKHILSNVSFEE